jgi:hypothetical protein
MAGQEGGKEEGKEGGREGGKEGGKEGGREGGREGRDLPFGHGPKVVFTSQLLLPTEDPGSVDEGEALKNGRRTPAGLEFPT